MNFYFSTARIPELAGLSRAQRKAVFQCALTVFYEEQPSRVWAGGPWILGGLLLGAFARAVVARDGPMPGKLLIIAACGLVGAIAGAFIAGQFQMTQLRPYFRRVLEERKEEIAKIL
jgi:uncharacterized membrane protein YeaQ/YmgE (transglycosylase-associated protein family)